MTSRKDAPAVLRHLHGVLRAARSASLTAEHMATLERDARKVWAARAAYRLTEEEERFEPYRKFAEERRAGIEPKTSRLDALRLWLLQGRRARPPPGYK